ncbi:MAG: hypothetical protein VKM34_05955 [Cyanobacteriota bacterium]|nr:hypothetical protein [Cyanobacteriota bacterium]
MTASAIQLQRTDNRQARRFLKLLGKDPTTTTRLRAFPHKKSQHREQIGARKGAFNLQLAERWNLGGRGVYLVINEGGDNKASITSCIALFVEWDDRPLDWQVTAWQELGLPEPTVIVSTGRSAHTYWVLKEPIPPAQWKPLQERLIAHCKSDPACKDTSRVMRLPGFWYINADDQPSHLVEIARESGNTYSANDIAACLPPLLLPEAPSSFSRVVPIRRTGDLPPRPDGALEEALAKVPEFCHQQGRRVELVALAFRLIAEVGIDPAQQLMAKHSPSLKDLAGYFTSEPDQINPGSIWPFLREKYGIDISRSDLKAPPRPQRPHRPEPVEQEAAKCPAMPDISTHPEPEPDATPYRVLGWCSDRARVYYQHRATGQIASIKPAAQAGQLLQLAPIGWWEAFHPRSRHGDGIDWSGACSAVIEAANRAGVFAPDRVRGRGLWMEGSRTVWHLGDRLEVDGQEVALIEHCSTHHYPRLPALDIDRTVAPLSDAEGREILAAVAAMGWATPLDHLHLLGWAVLANVGGALEKRPVLQITSRFGSGKTFTREHVLQPLLAGLAISRSNSTEAGIRQLLKADTLPVLIDESEGEDHSRREGHLRLARLSYDGSPTDRGTTHGQAQSYAIRSSVALMGINATINNPAERSRTVLVGREQLPQAEWAAVDRRLQELLTPETGARLLRRAINNLPNLRANVVTFRRAVEAQLGGGAAARAGDTYGALLAGAHLLTSEALVDDKQALDWLDSIRWSAAAAHGEAGSDGQDGTAESRQCLAHLLSHEEVWRSDTGTGRLSVRELLELARTPSGADDAEQARKALGRRGIRATDCGLEVANTPEALAPIYGKTKWRDGGHRDRLLDLPGAFAAGMVRFPVLGTCRASKVPWELTA